MKRIFLSIFILFAGLTVKAADFGTSADFMASYKDKIVGMTLGYDFGYHFFNETLYAGVGPFVGAAFADGYSGFSSGGYVKLRYIVPLNYPVRPFVMGRVGYGYDFKSESGDMFYGFGGGVHFAKHWGVGVYCAVGSLTTTSSYTERVVTHIGRQRGWGSQNDKTTYAWKTYTSEDTETTLTPSLYVTYNF